MTETDRRCGACKWFLPRSIGAIGGDCLAQVPDCIDPIKCERDVMLLTEGATCPCWEANE